MRLSFLAAFLAVSTVSFAASAEERTVIKTPDGRTQAVILRNGEHVRVQDPQGRLVERQEIRGNTVTTYDPQGRTVSRSTTR